MNWIEWIGYAASAFVALSMAMRNVKLLRMINLLGSTLFVVYGFFIESWPIAITNGLIVLINIYRIRDLRLNPDQFNLIEVDYNKSKIFYLFMNKYEHDIKKFFPEYTDDILERCKTNLIIRNMITTGIFIYEEKGKELYIHVDYVSADYRDFEGAKFFYRKMNQQFKDAGFKRFTTKSYNKSHDKYLSKLGFLPDSSQKGIFYLEF